MNDSIKDKYLEVDSNGFVIDGKRYNVNDVISYRNENKKSIILFGFYDNGLAYEDREFGCGFYTVSFNKNNNGYWEFEKFSECGIDCTLWYGDIETNQYIINQIRELLNKINK